MAKQDGKHPTLHLYQTHLFARFVLGVLCFGWVRKNDYQKLRDWYLNLN